MASRCEGAAEEVTVVVMVTQRLWQHAPVPAGGQRNSPVLVA